MTARDCLLVEGMRAPDRFASFSASEWDRVIRQGRRANLLARLAHLAREQGCFEIIPSGPRGHLRAAETLAARQTQAIQYELRKLAEAFAKHDLHPVLLKGAAYLASGQPCAQGRLFGDIDLMVPKEQLALAESALMLHGWNAGHHSEYDQRYYRRWMHEVPPLQHVTRLSIIDLHHAILPETARTPSPAAPLFEEAVDVANLPFRVLEPVDMVLHSATHLFHEGEFHNGLRDLCDLDILLRHFSKQNVDFWRRLDQRAASLNLRTSLRHALRYCRLILDTPVPDAYYPPAQAGIDFLFMRALAPEHSSCNNWMTAFSRRLLYTRGHWLRMPLHLLIPHLIRKSMVRDHDSKD